MRRVTAWRVLIGSAVLLSAAVPTAVAQELPAPKQSRSSGFDMLRSSSVIGLQGNRVYCGVWNVGELCVSVVGTNGAWPIPLYHKYIFNSGLQVAGIVATDAAIWAGDTVGAYIADLRGTQPHGEGVTEIFSSTSRWGGNDLERWPTGAVIRDPDVFHSTLLGRQFVSSEDAWFRAQDGPNQLSGRSHPMGILVEHRSLQFNHPAGNEDILYWVFTLYNISASDPGAYGGLDPAIQGEIAEIGASWVARTESRLGVDLPPSGYRVDSLYVGLAMDPDVGVNFSTNNASAVLPFETSVAYHSVFTEPRWSYPPGYAMPPFGPYPGFVGAALLRTPAAQGTVQAPGLTLFSTTTGSARFPYPVGVAQLWRYLSGNLSQAEGDPPCDFNPPKERRLCVLVQNPHDTRFYQSTGSFSLEPGESATVVMAYVFAWPVASAIEPAGTFVPPGIPPSGPDLVAGIDTVRRLDRAAGWVSHADRNGDGDLTPDEVETVPRSFLHKVKLARELVAQQFLLPTAPEAPDFFLVPGDDQVTVVWQKSATELTGDPYFAAASDPQSGLYDPNYRRGDVEGYRVYRGRSPEQLELVAQFDYQGTTFVDHTGRLDYNNECAPELGITQRCPTFPVTRALNGRLVQVPVGKRVPSGNLAVTLASDSAPAAPFPPLHDTGIPFVYVDTGVQNFYPYYYAVTAFDINSIASGPSSLESPLTTKAIRPRAPSSHVAAGGLGTVELLGRGDTVLNPTQTVPAIDSATGQFAGPMPPTDGLEFLVEHFVPELSTDGELLLTIDDITPGATLNAEPTTYHLTMARGAARSSFTLALQQHYGGIDRDGATVAPGIPLDSAKAALFRGRADYTFPAEVQIAVPGGYRVASWGRSDRNGDPGNSVQAGPRWWAGADNENVVGPNSGFCTPAASHCGRDQFAPDITLTAGRLPGVDTLFTPRAYSTLRYEYRNTEGVGATVYRQADMRVYWGRNGAIDSVIDVTHNVRVPFQEGWGPSWGILNVSGFANTAEGSTGDQDNGLITWQDGDCLAPVPAYTGHCGGSGQTPAVLEQRAALNPVSVQQTVRGATGMEQTGTGFLFYLNGGTYLMQMRQLPAAGTVWHYRAPAGNTTGTLAAGDYQFRPAIRPPAVPGLRARLRYTGTTFDPGETTEASLATVHTVPDPFYVTTPVEASPAARTITFVNLPARAIVRIYSVSGVLVDVIEHHDQSGSGQTTWDARNRGGRLVASGVYFYHVETPDGVEKVGRMTVIIGSNLGVPR